MTDLTKAYRIATSGGTVTWEVLTIHYTDGREGRVTLQHAGGDQVTISTQAARQLGFTWNDPRTDEEIAEHAEWFAAFRSDADVLADKIDAEYEASKPGLLDDLAEQAGVVGGTIGAGAGRIVSGAAKTAGAFGGSAIAAVFMSALPVVVGGALIYVIVKRLTAAG